MDRQYSYAKVFRRIGLVVVLVLTLCHSKGTNAEDVPPTYPPQEAASDALLRDDAADTYRGRLSPRKLKRLLEKKLRKEMKKYFESGVIAGAVRKETEALQMKQYRCKEENEYHFYYDPELHACADCFEGECGKNSSCGKLCEDAFVRRDVEKQGKIMQYGFIALAIAILLLAIVVVVLWWKLKRGKRSRAVKATVDEVAEKEELNSNSSESTIPSAASDDSHSTAC